MDPGLCRTEDLSLGTSHGGWLVQENIKMKTLCFDFAFLLLIGLAWTSGPECPHFKASSKCECAVINGRSIVSCSSISNPESLLQEVQNLRGYQIGDFSLIDAELPYLPAGLFSGTNIKRFHIKASHLDNLYNANISNPSPFRGLENSLEEFHVILTKSVDSWYWPDMRDFKQMKKIEFIHSPISFIGHNFAEIGGGSLESISAVHSKTYRLHPQGFTDLRNLREVDFSSNAIPYLVRTMFPNPAPRLEKLNFRANKLFTLNENMFENMPALEVLDLSYNEFKSFQEVPLRPIWHSLEYLGLQGNPFQCECNLVTLKNKYISGSVPPRNDFKNIACVYKGSSEKTSLIDVNRNQPEECLW